MGEVKEKVSYVVDDGFRNREAVVEMLCSW